MDDPILTRFRTALGSLYGDRLERVVLYGSRARGDHRPDSDYDIAGFLRDTDVLGTEMRQLAILATDILIETDAVINPLPFHAGAYEMRTGFMQELRTDGRDL